MLPGLRLISVETVSGLVLTNVRTRPGVSHRVMA